MDNIKLAEIIDKAIKREEEAFSFYMDLHTVVEDATAKDSLRFLAGEEKKHREFLVAYRDGKIGGNNLRMSEVIDYKIAQYVDAPDVSKDVNTRDIYLIAAHRELNSCNFYNSLADAQPDGEVKDMLQRMANEEMKHKEKVEYLYTNTAFPQTQGG